MTGYIQTHEMPVRQRILAATYGAISREGIRAVRTDDIAHAPDSPGILHQTAFILLRGTSPLENIGRPDNLP